MAPTIRPARREDARDLARLIDIAGEGLPGHLWAGMAGPGEAPLDIGTIRAARDSGGFSWRNAHIAEIDNAPAGALVSYRLGTEPQPIEDLPAIIRPLQWLENQAPGSHYINAIATYPPYRRRGIAAALMVQAESLAAGAPSLSLIVADGNAAALRLYASCGYGEQARAPLVSNGWQCSAENWLLLVKPLAG
ncbi:MAG: GNAT family N-acetyltransferase [Pararhodobacter sp.]|nr:GNAT family N-acetyltransferase [Pararhodobacter sp.]